MNVLLLMLFVSLMLVVTMVLGMVYSVNAGDHEHSDRMALAPLEEDDPRGD